MAGRENVAALSLGSILSPPQHPRLRHLRREQPRVSFADTPSTPVRQSTPLVDESPNFGEISHVLPPALPSPARPDDSALFSAGDSFSFDEDDPVPARRSLPRRAASVGKTRTATHLSSQHSRTQSRGTTAGARAPLSEQPPNVHHEGDDSAAGYAGDDSGQAEHYSDAAEGSLSPEARRAAAKRVLKAGDPRWVRLQREELKRQRALFAEIDNFALEEA